MVPKQYCKCFSDMNIVIAFVHFCGRCPICVDCINFLCSARIAELSLFLSNCVHSAIFCVVVCCMCLLSLAWLLNWSVQAGNCCMMVCYHGSALLWVFISLSGFFVISLHIYVNCATIDMVVDNFMRLLLCICQQTILSLSALTLLVGLFSL